MAKKPKKKCCVSKPRCKRCPLRMLAEGTLPAGYAVKKRRLVRLDADGGDVGAGKGAKKDKKDKKRKKKDRKRARVAAELAELPAAS